MSTLLRHGRRYRAHPLTSGVPPPWASSFGQDPQGVFAAFAVGELEYVLRYVPPGVVEGNGPGEPAQQVAGFWLGELPCTDQLWAKVSLPEGDAEHLGEGVEIALTRAACQSFLDALNARLPELRVRLPSELERLYTCGATAGRDPGAGRPRGGAGRSATGSPSPNGVVCPWGLRDLSADIAEWCCDTIAWDHVQLPSHPLELRPPRGVLGLARSRARAGAGLPPVPLPEHASLLFRLARDAG